VFRVFLKPGVTSVGGPIAHLGYFRGELLVRRKWIDEPGHGDLVALCQFLPGPASSQGDFRSACCAALGFWAAWRHAIGHDPARLCARSGSVHRPFIQVLRLMEVWVGEWAGGREAAKPIAPPSSAEAIGIAPRAPGRAGDVR